MKTLIAILLVAAALFFGVWVGSVLTQSYVNSLLAPYNITNLATTKAQCEALAGRECEAFGGHSEIIPSEPKPADHSI
jgi:hypothetical protein